MLPEEVKLSLRKLITECLCGTTNGTSQEVVFKLVNGCGCIPFAEGLEEVQLGEVSSLQRKTTEVEVGDPIKALEVTRKVLDADDVVVSLGVA